MELLVIGTAIHPKKSAKSFVKSPTKWPRDHQRLVLPKKVESQMPFNDRAAQKVNLKAGQNGLTRQE
jgi:hypothetical protein